MALQASTVWEVRTTGNNNNGGGYTSGGTDYSQQDAAQLSLTDIVADGTAVITSVTGGFTAAMVGNIINILTKGRFEIVGYTDTNTVTVDRAVVAGSGLSGYVGGAVADLEEIDSVIVAGNTVWTKNGSYTASGAISFTAGSTSNEVSILGYNTSRGDNPTGTDRPSYDLQSNGMTLGNFSRLWNFDLTSSNLTGTLTIGIANDIRNCKAANTAAAGEGIVGSSDSMITDCEIDAGASAVGIDLSGDNNIVWNCYIHDCYTGIQLLNQSNVMVFNIFDTCSQYGIQIASTTGRFGQTILNNVFYNCGDGIYAGFAVWQILCFNNIIDSCTTGINVATSNLFHPDYNNYYNNSTDVSGVSKGSNATANNPQFTNAAGGDFSLQSGSPCIGAGFSTRLGVG